nr:uncharacterized mitochondrial protein AtMg00810-like [Tanacetum cinerariifolium]
MPAKMQSPYGKQSRIGLEAIRNQRKCRRPFSSRIMETLLHQVKKDRIKPMIGYQTGLESLESRIVVHEKNKAVFEEDITFLKYDVQVKDISIKDLKNQLENALKEKDDLKLKLEKFKTSSKNLTKLINSQISAIDKIGLGYDGQTNESDLNDIHVNKSKVLNNVVESRESDGNDNQLNYMFKKGEGYHVIPHPYTRNYMLPRANLSFAGLNNSVFKSKVSETITSVLKIETNASKTSKDSLEKPKTVRSSAPLIEEWESDSEDENVFKPKEVKKTVKPSLEKIEFVNARNTTVENENKAAKPRKFSQSPRGYSINSKDFRVFNTRTRIVEENLHINFLKNKPNVVGIGPNWMFDIDTLTMSINYQPVFTENQTNGNAGTKAYINAGQAGKKTVPGLQYVLLPLLTYDSQGPKSSEDEFADVARKKSTEVLRKENKAANTNSTNILNTVSSPVNAVNSSFTTVDPGRERAQRNEFESIDGGYTYVNLGGSIPVNAATLPNADLPTDPLIPDLEDTADLQDTRIFSGAYDDEVKGAVADFNNLELITVENDQDFSRTCYGQLHQKAEEIQSQGLSELLICLFSLSNRTLEVKIASTPIETNKALLKDEEAEDVDVHLYRSMVGSLMYLTASRPDIMFAICACPRFQVTPKVLHLHAVKRIFRYLKSQPKLGLWYPKDSSFDLEAFSDSDYAGASLDKKSTTGGCQFLGKRLIS